MIAKYPYRLCKLYTFGDNIKKTWLIEFYQWNIISGRKERRFFSKFNSEKDVNRRKAIASKWMNLINQKLQEGAVYNPEIKTIKIKPVVIPTFIKDLADYMAYQKVVLAYNSYKSYNTFVYKWNEFAKINQLEKLKTVELTAAICNQFFSYLLTLGTSNTTINNTILKLKCACNFYTQPGRERFLISPARHIKKLPERAELHDPFSDEQVETIKQAIIARKDWQLLLFVYFIYYTFCRPGREIRLLKVKDIRERSVIINPKHSKTGIAKSPTIPKPLETLLQDLSIRDYDPDYYVFTTKGEPGVKPVPVNYFYNRHRAILTALEITGKHTLYSWKHTGNIKLFRHGIDLKSIQQQNGHANLEATEIYLRHLGSFANNEIYEKFV